MGSWQVTNGNWLHILISNHIYSWRYVRYNLHWSFTIYSHIYIYHYPYSYTNGTTIIYKYFPWVQKMVVNFSGEFLPILPGQWEALHRLGDAALPGGGIIVSWIGLREQITENPHIWLSNHMKPWFPAKMFPVNQNHSMVDSPQATSHGLTMAHLDIRFWTYLNIVEYSEWPDQIYSESTVVHPENREDVGFVNYCALPTRNGDIMAGDSSDFHVSV